MKTLKGVYRCKNPGKYKGNPSNIVYRSSWELKVMNRFDIDPNVIWWQSEEIAIPYRSPIDNRVHRYFPDFLVKTKDKTILIEVKPKKQTMPPMLQEGKKKSKKFINEVMTWGINEAKWKAATEYCKDRKWEFFIMTEEHLGVK